MITYRTIRKLFFVLSIGLGLLTIHHLLNKDWFALSCGWFFMFCIMLISTTTDNDEIIVLRR